MNKKLAQIVVNEMNKKAETKNEIIDYLKSIGHQQEDIEQIFEAEKFANFEIFNNETYSRKQISKAQAKKIMGFENYWAALGRAAFHGSSSANILKEYNPQGLLEGSVDCRSYFRNIE